MPLPAFCPQHSVWRRFDVATIEEDQRSRAGCGCAKRIVAGEPQPRAVDACRNPSGGRRLRTRSRAIAHGARSGKRRHPATDSRRIVLRSDAATGGARRNRASRPARDRRRSFAAGDAGVAAAGRRLGTAARGGGDVRDRHAPRGIAGGGRCERVWRTDPAQLFRWAQSRVPWHPQAALQMCQLLVEKSATQQHASQLKRQVAEISSHLLNTFEEITLLAPAHGASVALEERGEVVRALGALALRRDPGQVRGDQAQLGGRRARSARDGRGCRARPDADQSRRLSAGRRGV